MHSNTEGLSPSLRAQLGVGWNRVLPPPFAFDNGILPDGSNDVIRARALIGQALPNEITYTAWIKTPGTNPGSNGMGMVLISTLNTTGLQIFLSLSNNRFLTVGFNEQGGNNSALVHQLETNTIYQIEVYINFTTKLYRVWVDTILRGQGNFAWDADPFANPIQDCGLFIPSSVHGLRIAYMHDECILYNRPLSVEERMLNYNNGVGNNPAKTEGIIWWYDFSKAESDTDLNPGGNPAGWNSGVWGIRDKSTNGYHGQQVGFPNNATFGGALQPFI